MIELFIHFLRDWREIKERREIRRRLDDLKWEIRFGTWRDIPGPYEH